jgi:hypothetical protein
MMKEPRRDVVRLHPDDIEAIARRVAEIIAPAQAAPKTHLTAKQVVERYAVSLDWVYEHKRELGAQPMGQGKKPRWRFPIETCDAFFTEQAEERARKNAPRPQRRPRRRRAREGFTASGLPLLPIPELIVPREMKPLVSVYPPYEPLGAR